MTLLFFGLALVFFFGIVVGERPHKKTEKILRNLIDRERDLDHRLRKRFANVLPCLEKDEWIQKAKALLFDVECASDIYSLYTEAAELIDEAGGYDYETETSNTPLRWRESE